MALFALAPIARITRASMLAVLGSEFVRTARASGLPSLTVDLVYAFRNALLPVVTTLAMVFSFLLGANVLVEKVFAWPGIGSYAVEALIASDFAPVQGFVLTMAVLVCAAEPRHRPGQPRDRPAGAAAHERRRGAPLRRTPARHRQRCGMSRYTLGENPVTLIAVPAVRGLRAHRHPGGTLVAPYDPLASDTMRALQAPRAAHLFGTDQLGRDILSRVLVATRLDLGIALASVALVFAAGGLAGLAAGFFGGWVEAVIGRIADTIMAFPLFVLAMGIVAALGNTVPNIVLATAIINFPLYARVARAETMLRREAGFVDAARLSGHRDIGVLLGQVMPNIMPIMVVQMSLTMGYAILNAAGLSFIGLGVRPPNSRVGDHGRRGRLLHRLRRVVDRAVSRRHADAGGVLL